MVTKVITYRHCGSGDVVKNGVAPNNGKQKYPSVTLAGVKAAKILPPTATQKSARKRSCALTRSARVCVD